MKSVTYDEYAFHDYGREIVFNGTTSRPVHKYNSKMPMNALNVLPEFISKNITWSPLKAVITHHLDSPSHRYRYIYLARFVTVLFSLLLAIVVYLWAKDLYGQRAGLISLTIFAFSPNILAHSKVITADLYASCFIFIAVYTFWKYLKSPTTSNLLLSAVALGLAQLTKYTAVHLFPIFLVLAILTHRERVLEALRKKEIGKTCNMALRGLAVSLVFIVATIAIINIGFLFENTFVRFKEYPLKSGFFKTFKPVADNIRVPVPFPYLQGLDWVKYDDQMGKYGNLYLLGELQSVDKPGWWYYYIVAFLLKTPLGLLGLLCLCGLVAVDKKDKGWAGHWFLIIPALYFFLYFSLFFHTQVGIRYILPIYPFLFVLAGRVAHFRDRLIAMVVGMMVVGHVVSSLSYHPHYLSYFNELIGDRKNMYKYLADSNVDWGQNEKYLKRYLADKSDVSVTERREIGYWTKSVELSSGHLIVSVNALVGVLYPNDFRHIRERYSPVGHVAYSFLIYELGEKRLGRK